MWTKEGTELGGRLKQERSPRRGVACGSEVGKREPTTSSSSSPSLFFPLLLLSLLPPPGPAEPQREGNSGNPGNNPDYWGPRIGKKTRRRISGEGREGGKEAEGGRDFHELRHHEMRKP